jgi:hypothetical protein
MLLDLLLLQSWSLTDLIALGDQTDAPVRRGLLAPAHRRRTASRIHRAIRHGCNRYPGRPAALGRKVRLRDRGGGAGTGSHRLIRSPNASLARRWRKHGEAMRGVRRPGDGNPTGGPPDSALANIKRWYARRTHYSGQKQTRHHQSHTWRGTKDAQGASLVETLSECSLFSLANRTGPDPEYTSTARKACQLWTTCSPFLKYSQR